MPSAAALPFHNRIVYGHTDLPSFDRDTGPVSLPSAPAPATNTPLGEGKLRNHGEVEAWGGDGGGFVVYSDGFCFFFLLFFFLDLGENPPALEGEVNPCGGCGEEELAGLDAECQP